MSKRAKNKIDDQDKINVREKLTHNVLDLSLMNIAAIPVDEIKLLKRATVLDLSNNIITAVNADFTTLVQLTKLDLSKNNIRTIADEFGNLVNLRHLDLYNNKIERLPLSFGRLKKLKYLDLKNNPLNPVFSKVVGTCTDQKDCIEAARKAVAFMANIEQQVTEDRRKEREQREIEDAKEVPIVAEEKESNKEETAKQEKKRKRNKKSKAENANNADEGDKATGSTQKSKADVKGPVKISSCRSTGKIFLYFVVFVVLSIVGFGLVFVLKPEFVEHMFGVPGEILEEYIK